ncbi:MAG TPA: 1-deoxy-D-xylulose-5-phosphate reductoisomerase [Methylocystis sp.]|nr:1-deoxy-D-xylulose-5-phosphate reductoisomerase [Methylocystis sp.]
MPQSATANATAKWDAGQTPRRISVLGATGSIGKSTIDLLKRSPQRFRVVSLVAGGDATALAGLARDLKPEFVALRRDEGYAELRGALGGSNVAFGAGRSAVVEAAQRDADLVVSAIVGAAGVEPTHAALAPGRIIALANKECLVCAGGPFMRAAKKAGATLLPIDSEHNAIFQALGGADPATIERMTITASGGPFRLWSKEAIAKATLEQALKHPNWAMGPKNTLDSATLMNKGLELIEAHHLFSVGADRLSVVVHPQSIVHGLVYFADGSVTAGLAMPDMRTPIAHCLSYPERMEAPTRRLDLAAIGALTFEPPDCDRFPALRLALDALAAGGALPTVLNAANEMAVEAFINRRIGFSDIARHVEAALEAAHKAGAEREPATIDEALAVDHNVREKSRALLAA